MEGKMLTRFRRRIFTYAVVFAAFATRCGFCCAADPTSLADQGRDALLKGDWNGALAKLNEALQRDPNNSYAHLLRSCVNGGLGMIDPAIADATRAIEIGPPQAIAYSNRGGFYSLKGDLARAIADYDEAIRLAPRDAVLYSNRGSAYLKLHNTTKAIDDLSEAIRLDPKCSPALAGRGLALFHMGSYESAVRDMDELLRVTRAVFPLQTRAQANFRLGHPEKAFADLDEAVRLGYDLAQTYQIRAQMRSETGDDAGALADLTAMITIEPKDPGCYVNRAKCFLEQRQYGKAIADTDAAIAINPRYPYAFAVRGAAWIYRGDTDRGLADIATMIRLKPDDTAAKFDDGGKKSISSADLAHGREQVARMLKDRPGMARYSETGSPLAEWAARKFAGEDLGRRIYWDSAEPPSFAFGENRVLGGERGAIIRVSKNICDGNDKGNPQSFDELWSGAVFELYNIANHPEFCRIDYEASRGRLIRAEFVERVWECERRAAQKTRAFYIRVFLPWAKLKRVPSHPRAWNLTSYTDESSSGDVCLPRAYRGYYELEYDRFEFTRLLENREFAKAYDLSQSRLKAAASPEERAVAFWMCGKCRAATGGYQAALEFCNQAIEANKNEPLAYVGRGAARQSLGDVKGAIADYSEAIRLGPLDCDTYLARAQAYRASGDEKSANSDLAEGLRLKAQQSGTSSGDQSPKK